MKYGHPGGDSVHVRNLLSSWGISVLLHEQLQVMVLLQGLVQFPATLQEAAQWQGV